MSSWDDGRFRVTDKQVSSTLEDEVVILHTGQGRYYGLNRTGARIWALLTRTASLSEIVRELLQRYDIDEETCRRDVVSVLDQLHEHALMHRS